MGRSPGKRSTSRTTLVVLFLGVLASAASHTAVGYTGTAATRIYVACAANFYAPLKQLVTAYRDTHDRHSEILISSGSSGSLFRQIMHGSPHQIFLSADSFYPEQLERAKRTLPNTRTTYAVGELLLWHPGIELDTVQQLAGQRLTLAIANPKTAPYGKAALEVLKRLDPAMPWRLVVGSSIAQTHQFIDSGNARAGIISRSLIDTERSDIKSIPDNWYPALLQQMVLTDKAANQAAVHRLFAYITSEPAQRIIEKSGYRLPVPTLPRDSAL